MSSGTVLQELAMALPLQALHNELLDAVDINIFSNLKGSHMWSVVRDILKFIFILYEIPICAISGIALLVKKKKIELGVFCLRAAII